MSETNGLDESEQEIMNHLTSAFNGFSKLKPTHPDEKNDFRYAIHLAQNLLAMRALRRTLPDGWFSL